MTVDLFSENLESNLEEKRKIIPVVTMGVKILILPYRWIDRLCTKHMIIRMFFFFCISILCVMGISAQRRSITIDTANLRCQYKTLYYTDTTDIENGVRMEGNFILQIGRKVSKYYEFATELYKQMRSDPKAWSAYINEVQIELDRGIVGGASNIPILSRVDPLVIYTGFPIGKRTVQDAVFLDYYIYEEDLKPQEWMLIPDSGKIILGYVCRKALCSYRGRNYEAWYCPDIPTNMGPWKFLGLPGLILSVRDVLGHYTFDLTGLEITQEPIEYVEYIEDQYIHTDRITFLRTQSQSARIGIARYMQLNAPAGNASSVDKSTITSETARYDLLEMDYKK